MTCNASAILCLPDELLDVILLYIIHDAAYVAMVCRRLLRSETRVRMQHNLVLRAVPLWTAFVSRARLQMAIDGKLFGPMGPNRCDIRLMRVAVGVASGDVLSMLNPVWQWDGIKMVEAMAYGGNVTMLNEQVFMPMAPYRDWMQGVIGTLVSRGDVANQSTVRIAMEKLVIPIVAGGCCSAFDTLCSEVGSRALSGSTVWSRVLCGSGPLDRRSYVERMVIEAAKHDTSEMLRLVSSLVEKESMYDPSKVREHVARLVVSCIPLGASMACLEWCKQQASSLMQLLHKTAVDDEHMRSILRTSVRLTTMTPNDLCASRVDAYTFVKKEMQPGGWVLSYSQQQPVVYNMENLCQSVLHDTCKRLACKRQECQASGTRELVQSSLTCLLEEVLFDLVSFYLKEGAPHANQVTSMFLKGMGESTTAAVAAYVRLRRVHSTETLKRVLFHGKEPVVYNMLASCIRIKQHTLAQHIINTDGSAVLRSATLQQLEKLAHVAVQSFNPTIITSLHALGVGYQNLPMPLLRLFVSKHGEDTPFVKKLALTLPSIVEPCPAKRRCLPGPIWSYPQRV